MIKYYLCDVRTSHTPFQGEMQLHVFFTYKLYMIFLWWYLTVRQSWALWGIWTLKWNVNLLFIQSDPKSSLLLSANKKIDEIDDGWNENSSQLCTRSISLTQSRRPSFSVSILLVLFFLCLRFPERLCPNSPCALTAVKHTCYTKQCRWQLNEKQSAVSQLLLFSFSFLLSFCLSSAQFLSVSSLTERLVSGHTLHK